MLKFNQYCTEFDAVLSDVSLDMSESQQLDEVLDVAARRKKALDFKRRKSRLLLARKLASKRFPTPQKIKQRAVKRARAKIIARLTQGRGKGALSYQQRAIIDARLKKMKGGVTRLANKLVRQVRADAMSRVGGGKSAKGPSAGGAV